MFNVITIAPFSCHPEMDRKFQTKLNGYPLDQLVITNGRCKVEDEKFNHWLSLQALQAQDIASASNALANRPQMPVIDLSKWLVALPNSTLLLMEMISHNLARGTQVAVTFDIDSTEMVTCKVTSKVKSSGKK